MAMYVKVAGGKWGKAGSQKLFCRLSVGLEKYLVRRLGGGGS